MKTGIGLGSEVSQQRTVCPQPVDLVDAALRVASVRELFTRDEATQLLHQLEQAVHVDPRHQTIEAIVTGAESSWAGQLMIPSVRLVDSLLDIRGVLAD
jgi:hypothetical protein